jgi:hypothetical protein
LLVLRYTDVDLVRDPEWLGDIPQYVGDPPTGRPPDDLADQVAEGLRVVGRLGARLPPRLGRGEVRRDRRPPGQVLDRGAGR